MPNQAPSYFHWTEGRPVTTNQVYGFNKSDYPDLPHPERPKNFFKDIRPFDNLEFYPDMLHDWQLAAQQTRSDPLRQWRPSRGFCLKVGHHHTIHWSPELGKNFVSWSDQFETK
jgi:hypothetical protein